MTKALTKAEKKQRKDERRKRSDQQKAPSTTKTTVNVPKPEGGKAEEGANLCDTCAYEFGECEGTPKFGEEEGADNVVECKTWTNVEDFPTADQGKKDPPAEPPQGEPDAAAHDGDDNPPNEPGGDQGDEPELVHENVKEGATEEDKEADRAVMLADLPARPDPKRFQEDKTDRGTCPACERPLKRTAFNRYRDAIRCTNPRCPQYRAVVKTVGTGVL